MTAPIASIANLFIKIYDVGTNWKHLNEVLPKTTNNIYYVEKYEIKKWIALLSIEAIFKIINHTKMILLSQSHFINHTKSLDYSDLAADVS